MLQRRSWARSWAATSGVPCSHSPRTPSQGTGRQENGPAADRGANVKLWQAPRLAKPPSSATCANMPRGGAQHCACMCAALAIPRRPVAAAPSCTRPGTPQSAPGPDHCWSAYAAVGEAGRARLHKSVHVFKKQVAMASVKRAGLWVGRGAGGDTAGAPPEEWGTASAGAHSVHALQCTGGWGAGGVTMLGCLTVPHVERRFQPVRHVMSGIRLTLVSTHPTCSRGPAGMTCRVALWRSAQCASHWGQAPLSSTAADMPQKRRAQAPCMGSTSWPHTSLHLEGSEVGRQHFDGWQLPLRGLVCGGLWRDIGALGISDHDLPGGGRGRGRDGSGCGACEARRGAK